MAKLYTRTGDDGSTGLFNGSRVAKDEPRIAAIGDVDELNAQIGVTISALTMPGSHWNSLRERLGLIQNKLFDLGAELAIPDSPTVRKGRAESDVSARDVERLEGWIDQASSAVPPLKSFILPGGSETAARFHACRTVCRRTERTVVALRRHTALNPHILTFVNRLSDLLFVWARYANHLSGVQDVPWVRAERGHERGSDQPAG